MPVLSLVEAADQHGLRDVPLQLRRLADRMEEEARQYGEGYVCRVVVVARSSGREPAVMAYGDIEHIAQAYMDLHAGADELMAMRHPERT